MRECDCVLLRKMRPYFSRFGFYFLSLNSQAYINVTKGWKVMSYGAICFEFFAMSYLVNLTNSLYDPFLWFGYQIQLNIIIQFGCPGFRSYTKIFNISVVAFF